MMESLVVLRYSDGYNPLFANTIPAGRLGRMGFFLSFASDYNLMSLFFVLPLIAALSLYLYQKYKPQLSEDRRAKVNLYKKELLTDLMMVLAITSTYGIVFAFVIDVRADLALSVGSMVFGAIMLLLLIGFGLFFAVRKGMFE